MYLIALTNYIKKGGLLYPPFVLTVNYGYYAAVAANVTVQIPELAALVSVAEPVNVN